MFISLIKLLIHLTGNTSKSYELIYHPDPNELTSLNLKMVMGGESAPTLLFTLSSRSRKKLWPNDGCNNESAKKIPVFDCLQLTPA